MVRPVIDEVEQIISFAQGGQFITIALFSFKHQSTTHDLWTCIDLPR